MPKPEPEGEVPELASKPALSADELLLSDDYFRGEMDIPARGQLRHRPLLEFYTSQFGV